MGIVILALHRYFAQMKRATLVFDFGNVIGFFSHLKAAEQLSKYTTASVDKLRQTLFHGETEIELESGRLTPESYRELMRKELAIDCHDHEFDAAFSDMFTPNPDVCPWIPELAKRHRLLLLSNTNRFHAAQFTLQFASILSHFDQLFLSHEMGMRKPSDMIYRTLNEKSGTTPEECLFIDDMEDNIASARKCGWRSILYKNNQPFASQLEAEGIIASSMGKVIGEDK